MKKLLVILMTLMLVFCVMLVPTVALADGGTDPVTIVGGEERLIEYAVQIAATLLMTLIGVLGTYITKQLSKSTKLRNINDAQKELIRVAKITVGELQQTVVGDLKAAAEDGKLTQGEIAQLRMKLVDNTLGRLSAPAYALLQAASVDIESMILGVGEAWIDKIKNSREDPTASDE